MTKLKNKKNRQRILSILLVFALVITGLFAFLSATDTKTNVFTIGNIKAELWEDFDIDKDGRITDGTNDTPDNVFGPETTQPPTVENILPGDTILKQPYVKNTGSNEEWVYMIVQVPLEDKDDLIASTDGSIGLTDGAANPVEERVIVTAYAVQDNYNNETTLAGIWGELTATGGPLDASTYFGTASNDSDLVQIFTINGLDTTTWTPLAIGSGTAGAPFKSANGYNYYAYGYSTKLPAKAANESTYPQTSELFQSVTFANAVGETEPVVVNYFGLNSNSGSGSGTGAGSADLSIYVPSIPGYHLVHQDTVTPNTGITLYFDDSLAQTGKTFSWVDSETNEEAYSGMKVSSTTNLLATYDQVASSAELAQDYSFLAFIVSYDNERECLVASAQSVLDTSKQSYTDWAATQDKTIVIPASIAVTLTDQHNTNTSSGVFRQALMDYSRAASAIQLSSNDQVLVPSNFPLGTYEVPVVSCFCGNIQNGTTTISSSGVKKIIFPDSAVRASFGNCSTVEEVYYSYGCQQVSGGNCSNLTTVNIPNSVIAVDSFQNSGLTEITIPKSVQVITNLAFKGNPLEKIVMLAENPTEGQGSWAVNNSFAIATSGGGLSLTSDVLSNVDIYWNGVEYPRIYVESGNIVLSANVEYVNEMAFPHSMRINGTLYNLNPAIKYCGTESDFASLTVGSGSHNVGGWSSTIAEAVTANQISLANTTYNYTDPYAA